MLNFSKKKKLLVEIPVFCSNIKILDYHRKLSIIFATKTDNSITQKMAKLSIIGNNNFRYINTNQGSRYYLSTINEESSKENTEEGQHRDDQ
jgi:hypothetical protein